MDFNPSPAGSRVPAPSTTSGLENPKQTAPRPGEGPSGGKADLSQLGHGCCRTLSSWYKRPAVPSTLSSQVGKGPGHLSRAAPTPIPQLGPQPLPLRLPCNHSFLFGAENRPGQWGRGAAIPLARACSGVRGPEVKATRPPGILGGWEPRQGGRRGVSQQIFTRHWPRVPRMWGTIRGKSKPSQVVEDQASPCFPQG